MKDRNRTDLAEIERLQIGCEQTGHESDALTSQLKTLEFEISKGVNHTEELNRTIEKKTYELKQKEQHLSDCGREI